MEGTIEETLEENDVVLDGLNNDSIEETLEENNVHSDSIVVDECRYCEDAVPIKSFKAHTNQCRKFDKFVNKTANACYICERKFSSLKNVFLHAQLEHPLLNEFDEIDIDEESMIENHNIVTPNLGPRMISGQNPDVASISVNRDPNG